MCVAGSRSLNRWVALPHSLLSAGWPAAHPEADRSRLASAVHLSGHAHTAVGRWSVKQLFQPALGVHDLLRPERHDNGRHAWRIQARRHDVRKPFWPRAFGCLAVQYQPSAHRQHSRLNVNVQRPQLPVLPARRGGVEPCHAPLQASASAAITHRYRVECVRVRACSRVRACACVYACVPLYACSFMRWA
jgi:hypothetical protein